MSRRRPRGLTDEERALWQKVKDSALPLRPEVKRTVRGLPDGLAPRDPEPQATDPKPLAPFRIGEARTETALPPSAPAQAPRLDGRRAEKLRRGRMRPEARLDLHGMTLAQAQLALTRFITASQSKGRRLVLVITGTGAGRVGDSGPIERPGALRRQVPAWLRLPPLDAMVLEVAEAHPRHGGAGALYVYLRRRR